METLLILFYGAWLVLTILISMNVRPVVNLKLFDIFNIVPSWRFFSPNPPQYNYFLLYRDKIGNTVGRFCFFSFTSRPFFNLLYNPGNRLQIAFFKVVKALEKKVSEETNVDNIVLSHPYIHLLGIVMKRELQKDAKRQFVLVRTNVDNPGGFPEIILASYFHGH